jgi:hypothetical protein
MNAIEEIINIEDLVTAFNAIVESDRLPAVMEEIILQSKVEFNYIDDLSEAMRKESDD